MSFFISRWDLLGAAFLSLPKRKPRHYVWVGKFLWQVKLLLRQGLCTRKTGTILWNIQRESCASSKSTLWYRGGREQGINNMVRLQDMLPSQRSQKGSYYVCLFTEGTIWCHEPTPQVPCQWFASLLQHEVSWCVNNTSFMAKPRSMRLCLISKCRKVQQRAALWSIELPLFFDKLMLLFEWESLP